MTIYNDTLEITDTPHFDHVRTPATSHLHHQQQGQKRDCFSDSPLIHMHIY